MVPEVMTNEKVREDILILARAMRSQEKRDVGPRLTSLESTMTSRLRDFVRISPLTFLGSKVGDDPQAFLDEVYNIFQGMYIYCREKEE